MTFAIPSQAHWADLAVADIQIGVRAVEINLTIPTGLVERFDDDKDRKLSALETATHQSNLQQFLNEKLQLTTAKKTWCLDRLSDCNQNFVAKPNCYARYP